MQRSLTRASLWGGLLFALLVISLLTVRHAPAPVVSLRESQQRVERHSGRFRVELSPEADPSTLRVTINDEDVTRRFRLRGGGAVGRLEGLVRGDNRLRVTVDDRAGNPHAAELSVASGDPAQRIDSIARVQELAFQLLQARQAAAQRNTSPALALVELVEKAIASLERLDRAGRSGPAADAERTHLASLSRGLPGLVERAERYYGADPTAARAANAGSNDALERTVVESAGIVERMLEEALVAQSAGVRQARERLEQLIANPHTTPAKPLDPRRYVFPTRPPNEDLIASYFHGAASNGGAYAARDHRPELLLDEPAPTHRRRGGGLSVDANLAHAQGSNPDLDPSTGVRFDPVIVEKAAELGNDPIAIDEFVHNEIEFELYGGLTRGATATLLAGAGNNADQVALLVALLRVSGYPARFVVGDIFAEDAQVYSWLQIPSQQAVRDLVDWYLPRPSHMAAQTNNVGGYLFFEHWWAKVAVPYGPDQGRDPDAPVRWIFLDPSFKTHDARPGYGLQEPTEFDTGIESPGPGVGFIGAVTRRTAIEEFAEHQRPALRAEGHTLADVTERGPIHREELGALPAALPYRAVQYHLEFTDVGDLPASELGGPAGFSLDRKDLLSPRTIVEFQNGSGQVLNRYEFAQADISSQRVSVGYREDPTSPQSIAGDCQGDLRLCPNMNQIFLDVVLTVDGLEANPAAIPEGTPTADFVTLGQPVKVRIGTTGVIHQISCAHQGASNCDPLNLNAYLIDLHRDFRAGASWVLHTDVGQGSPEAFDQRVARVLDHYAQTDGQACFTDPTPDCFAILEQDREELLSELLYLISLRYSQRLKTGLADARDWNAVEWVLDGIGQAQSTLEVKFLDSTPVAILPDAFVFDAFYTGSAFDNDYDTTADPPDPPDLSLENSMHRLMILEASSHEHQVIEEITQLPSVSTVKGLQFAAGLEPRAHELFLEDPVQHLVCLPPCIGVLPPFFLPSDAQAQIAMFVNDHYQVTTTGWEMEVGDWLGYVFLAEKYEPGERAAAAILVTTGTGATNGATSTQSIPSKTEDYNEQSNQGANAGSRDGDPVNLISGNLDHSEVDFVLPTVGSQPIVLERTYNSQFHEVGPFGYGWTHHYNVYLEAIDEDVDGVAERDATDPANDDDVDGIVSGVAMVDGRGSQRRFGIVGDANGPYQPALGEDSRLELDATAGQLVLTLRDGTQYRFPQFASGSPAVQERVYVAEIRDPNGNTTSLTYDDSGAGRLEAATDELGRSLLFGYADPSATLIESVTDWSTRTWTYTYQGSDLVGVQNPFDSGAVPPRVTSHYEYYSGGFTPDLVHNLKRVQNALGEGATYLYYSNDRVYKTLDDEGTETSYVYDVLRHETGVTNAAGNRELYQYDDHSRIVRIVHADATVDDYAYDPSHGQLSQETNALGEVTLYEHDAFGNLKKETRVLDPLATPPGPEIQYTYWYETHGGTPVGSPLHNRLVERVDRNGTVFGFDYDTQGNLTLETVEIAGQTVELREQRYDGYGNRTKLIENIDVATPEIDEAADRVTDFTYDETLAFQLVAIANGFGGETHYIWDTHLMEPDRGLIRRVETTRTAAYPDGTSQTVQLGTETVYDLLGRPTLERNSLGTEFVTAYDEVGRVAQRIVRARDGTGGDPVDRTTSFAYDLAGRVTHVTDALGGIAKTQYDLLGRVVKTIDRTGRAIRFDYDVRGRQVAVEDANGAKTRFVRDGLGRILYTIDPNGDVTEFAYDPEGNLEGATDADQKTSRFRYDANGNRTGIQNGRLLAGQLAEGGNAQGNSTTFEYDELNRLILTRDALDQEMVYTLDLLGNAVEVRDAEGHPTSQEFDRLGRLVRRTDARGKTETFTYDNLDNLIAIEDRNGNLTKVFYDLANLRATVVSGGGSEEVFGFNGFGDRILERSAAVTYITTHDALGRPIRQIDSRFKSAIRSTYDAEGRLASLTDLAGGVAQYRYDKVGRLATAVAPDGTQVKREYDAAGRMKAEYTSFGAFNRYRYTAGGGIDRIEHFSPSDTSIPIQTLDYSYDENGNRKQVTRNGAVELYEFDDVDRLKTVTYADSSQQLFDYDAVGNRKYESDRGAERWYVYDDANRLTEVSDGTAVLHTYDYDDNGNRLSLQSADGSVSVSYQYDRANQLVEVDDGAQVWQFAYDASGQRVQQIEPTQVRKYTWALGNPLSEHDGATLQPTARFLHGPGLDQLLLVSRGGATGFAHRDAVGSVTGFSEAQADPVMAAFDAFGSLRIPSAGAFANDVGFTGRPVDGTGLLYLRARFYDPMSGRFLNEDPIGLAGGINLYAYARNNPTTQIDRTGLSPTTTTQVAVAPNVVLTGPQSQGASPVTGTFGVPVVPGAGSVRGEFFIEAERALILAGDARGFDVGPNPTNSRAFFTLDFEAGQGSFQINPTCLAGGIACRSALPIGGGNSLNAVSRGNSVVVIGSLKNSILGGPSIDFGIAFNATSRGVSFTGFRNAFPSFELTSGSTFLYRSPETHPLRLFDITPFETFSGP